MAVIKRLDCHVNVDKVSTISFDLEVMGRQPKWRSKSDGLSSHADLEAKMANWRQRIRKAEFAKMGKTLKKEVTKSEV